MEIYNCKNIDGVDINRVKFNVDGTVVGILETINGEEETNLSYECCISNDWEFDPNDAKCYWSSSCINEDSYNIILNPQGNTGTLYQIDENQEGRCHLELEFKWLLKFNCRENIRMMREIIEQLKLNVRIEKVVFDDDLPIPLNLQEVVSEELFNVRNIYEFFENTRDTGIILSGEDKDCESVMIKLKDDLKPNNQMITENSLNSNWVKFKLIIDDSETLEKIKNERIKITINGNKLYNYSILLDDVQLNRICDIPQQPIYLKDECPKFELKRVIDNKKSWVNNNSAIIRNFDLQRRNTKYSINDEKLSINTKEIDLTINPSQAINNDIFKNVVVYPCLLKPASGCTIGDVTHNCVDISTLITKPLTEIIDNNELLNMLINVKNRKTISGYPTIELLYYRYRNSEVHCGVDTNYLNGETINSFVDLIGSYWVDLIEQLIPATTIWGTSVISENDNFGGSIFNKYKYKKYSTITCKDVYNSFPSPTKRDVNFIQNGVKVEEEDISNNENAIYQKCDNSIYIKQINDGSEFIGTVTIFGNDEGPTSGSTISITESIINDCDFIGECGTNITPFMGDFDSEDFNNDDWYV